MTDWIRARGRGIAGLVALALLACASPGPEGRIASPPSPALWRADAAGKGTLYLLGSVHMGPEAGHRFGPIVDEAWHRSDELVVEIDVSQVTPSERAAVTREYGTLRAPTTLADVISGTTWGQLAAYLGLRGIDRQQVAHFKPWFMTSMMIVIELELAGYDAEQGVDVAFIRAARGSDPKPIVALESLTFQSQMMDRIPASLQELMLRDALVRIDHFPDDTAELLDAWRRGDERALEKLVFQPLDEYPELELFYDLVYFQRNHTMAAALERLSGDGRTRFAILGAGHMIGDRGVPALLRQRGFRVVRER